MYFARRGKLTRLLTRLNDLAIYHINVSYYLCWVPCSLSPEECDKTFLPTLERASLVHSHLHHPADESAASPDTFEQTKNAIAYISVSWCPFAFLCMV